MNRSSDWWDQWFMELAFHAATASKDPSTKVGAVIVGAGDRRKISLGYNGFPPGIKDDERMEDRPTKYSLTIHAERNALDNATFDVVGGTLYCTAHPCRECAKSIISRRIARVVTSPIPRIEKGRWTEELPEAQALLVEAKIEVSLIGFRSPETWLDDLSIVEADKLMKGEVK